MLRLIIFCSGILAAAAVSGQGLIDAQTPAASIMTSATVGSPILERRVTEMAKAYRLDQDAIITFLFAPAVTIPAGTPLYANDYGGWNVGCLSRSPALLAKGDYSVCYADSDGDGHFDKGLSKGVQNYRDAKRLVPYSVVHVPQSEAKRVWIFLGSDKSSMRISYREFKDDMARPAFTEDYQFPLNETFPQTVAFKDVRLKIWGVDGSGLRYWIEP